MRRLRKISVLVFAIVFAGIVLAYIGQFAYLRTDSAKRLAAEKIGDKLGGEVRVTEMSGGFASTEMHIEIPGNPGEKPLASGKVRVDVSPLALAIGSEPGTIHLDKPVLNLHLDK